MRVYSVLYLVTVSLLFFGGVSGHAEEPVKAAEAPAEAKVSDGLSLEDILSLKVEVASAFKESELEAGSAISVVNAEDWKSQGSVKQFEALDFQAGMLKYMTALGSQFMAIRGYASTSSPKGTTLMFDGIPLNDYYFGTGIYGAGNIDLGVIGRMELIRGPASYIYGSDAFHGVISMKPWASDKNTSDVRVGYGTTGLYRTEAHTSQALGDNFRINVVYGSSGQGNQNHTAAYTGAVNNSSPPPAQFTVASAVTDQRNLDQSTAGVKVIYKEKTEAAVYYTSFDAVGWPYLGDKLASTLPSSAQAFGVNSGNKTSSILAKVSNSTPLGAGFELDSKIYNVVTNYDNLLRANDGFQYNTTFTQNRQGYGLLLKRDRTQDMPTRFTLGYNSDTFGIGNRNMYTTGSFNATIPGGSAALNRAVGAALKNAVFPSGIQAVTGGRTINGVTLMTDTAFLNNKAHFLLGARQDSYSDLDSKPVSPRVGLVYLLNETSSVKLLHGTGFRAPAYLEVNGNGGVLAGGGSGLQAETIVTDELQYLVITSKNYFSTNLFYDSWENGIILNSSSKYANAGKNKAYGVEISDRAQVTGSLNLIGNLSYTQSYATSAAGDISYYTVYPLWMANWGAQYRIPSANLDLTLMNHNQTGQSIGTTVESGPLPDYFRTDLSASYDWGGLIGRKPKTTYAGLDIRNLFNRTLVNGSPSNLAGGVPEQGISGLLTASTLF